MTSAGTSVVQPERPDLVRGAHCFVLDVAVWGNTPHAGLLLEWRQQDGQWQGLVVAAEAFSGGWQVRQRWVDASLIRAVEAD